LFGCLVVGYWLLVVVVCYLFLFSLLSSEISFLTPLLSTPSLTIFDHIIITTTISITITITISITITITTISVIITISITITTITITTTTTTTIALHAHQLAEVVEVRYCNHRNSRRVIESTKIGQYSGALQANIAHTPLLMRSDVLHVMVMT
jgi:hypothetical protein